MDYGRAIDSLTILEISIKWFSVLITIVSVPPLIVGGYGKPRNRCHSLVSFLKSS